MEQVEPLTSEHHRAVQFGATRARDVVQVPDAEDAGSSVQQHALPLTSENVWPLYVHPFLKSHGRVRQG
jgi:hypothetical protein